MATLNETTNGKPAKGRAKKTAPRVDLTAMVDLMFLLITFFMLTTSLGTLNAADIAKPDECDGCTMDFPASRTMTILLGKNKQAISYLGTADASMMRVTSTNNIQKEIKANKLKVANVHADDPSKYMIVVIKPTKTAKFQDFVDAIDEMKIADIRSYSVDDKNILKQEADFLKSKGL